MGGQGIAGALWLAGQRLAWASGGIRPIAAVAAGATGAIHGDDCTRRSVAELTEDFSRRPNKRSLP